MQKQLESLLFQVKKSLKPLLPMLRHHFFIMLLLLLGFLIYAVLMVSDTISQKTDPAIEEEARKKGIQTQFDKKTIDRIDDLRKSDEVVSPPSIETGKRLSPFSE